MTSTFTQDPPPVIQQKRKLGRWHHDNDQDGKSPMQWADITVINYRRYQKPKLREVSHG